MNVGQAELELVRMPLSLSVTCDDSQFKAIKFPNIFTAFLLLGTGVAVAWIVGVCERAFPKYKEDHVARKQKERK